MGRQEETNMANTLYHASGYYAGFPSVSAVLRLSVVVTNRKPFIMGQNSDEDLPDPR